MMRTTVPLVLCTCILLVVACDLVDPDAFEPEVVVESYQIAEERLQPVRLSWSAEIDEAYDPDEHAITGAEIVVELLDEEGAVEEHYVYEEANGMPGMYITASRAHVQPTRRYRLRINIPDRPGEITAQTVVPDTFRVLEQTADTLTYQQTRAEIVLSKSVSPGRQTVYIFSTTALDPEEENLTPFYRSLLEASSENVTLKDLEVTSSGALNEANFSSDEAGNIRLEFPWLAIAFYGPNLVSIAAIDDAYHDFVRSQQAQQGGFGFSPGEIPNVISNVEGGTGLFGSFAREQIALYVRR